MTKSLHKINKICFLTGGLVLVVMALLIRQVAEQPLILLHNLGAVIYLPPLWLLNLLWLTGYFLVGGAWGQVLSLRACGMEKELLRYKGSMFLVLAVFLSFVWYLLFFGMQAFFLSWMCLVITIIMTAVAAVCYIRTFPPSGWSLFLWIIWLVYLLVMQAVVMLHI